jgi:hypothetical protein
MTSLKRFDGELTVDNRATGLSVPGHRHSFVQTPTLHCYHCGACVVINPDRTRAREYCRTCDHYICDGCGRVAALPDYVHRTIDDLTEMVTSGRYTIVGGSVCEPLIIPTSGVK